MWCAFMLCFVLSVAARLWYQDLIGEVQGKDLFIQTMVVGIFLFIPSVVCVPLAGLVPWNGQRYGRRVLNRLPFVLAFVGVLVLGLASMEVWYPPLVGMKRMADVDFNALNAEPGTDCTLVRDGVFENANLRIERKGTHQHQTERLGIEVDRRVEWPTPCEYTLRSEEDTLVLRVKILKVDSSGYECAHTYAGQERLIYRSRFERVHQTTARP